MTAEKANLAKKIPSSPKKKVLFFVEEIVFLLLLNLPNR
jgi:hypothetical protein